mgnify:FL=1
MLSTLYTEYEIKFQKQNIIFLLNELVKKNNKLLVITGHNPVFVNNKGINPLFSILLKNKNLELTYLDLDKKYFKKLSKKFERFSNDIKIFSDKLNLIYLNKYDYSCNINEKSCKSLTSEGNLIYFDGIHYTIEGAKYFGKKIYEIGWLRPIDNYFKNYKY